MRTADYVRRIHEPCLHALIYEVKKEEKKKKKNTHTGNNVFFCSFYEITRSLFVFFFFWVNALGWIISTIFTSFSFSYMGASCTVILFPFFFFFFSAVKKTHTRIYIVQYNREQGCLFFE